MNQSLLKPTFDRPLLEYAKAMRRHQTLALNEEMTAAREICEHVVKNLESLQDAYELLPGKVSGRWFLGHHCESTHTQLRNRCSLFECEIGEIRSSLSKHRPDDTFSAINQTLEELQWLFLDASDDLSRLSRSMSSVDKSNPSLPDAMKPKKHDPNIEA
jgi:hypothetical protein